MQQLTRYSDNDIDEERAVEKFLRVVPKKYSQVAIAIEMLLHFSELSIEEVTGHLKAVDNHKQLPLSEPINIGSKLLFIEEQWLARQRERKKGEASGSLALGSSSSRKRRLRKRDKARGGAPSGVGGKCKATRDDTCNNCGRTGHWPRTVGRRSVVARHTSRKHRRVMRRLCSSYTGASSRTPLPRQPPPRSSASTSHGPTSSSAMGPAATRSTGGASTSVPLTT
jgi:hypothetical protein